MCYSPTFSTRSNSSNFPADAAFANGIINAALAPLSLFFNFNLILAVLFNRAARTAENMLKANISLANVVLVSTAQIPFLTAMLGFTDTRDQLYRSVGVTTIASSFAALSLLTIERYIAIYHPFSHYKILMPRSLLLSIISSWLVSFGLGTLTFLDCPIRTVAFMILAILKVVMASFMVFANARFLATLFKIHREVASLAQRFNQSDRDRAPRNLKGVHCIIACLVLLLACHAPYSMIYLQNMVLGKKILPSFAYIITLAYMPAVVIPLLVIWTTKILRTAIFSFYCRICSILPI